MSGIFGAFAGIIVLIIFIVAILLLFGEGIPSIENMFQTFLNFFHL